MVKPVALAAGEQTRAAPAWLDVAGLMALGLVVNGLASRLVTQPGYMDAYYYFGGARQLAAGRGFTEPYLWNYLAPVSTAAPGAWSWPSHLYWMPLASILGAPVTALAGWLAGRLGGGAASNGLLFRAAQSPFILLASLAPLLAYAIARLVAAPRRHAFAAALLTLFSPFYFEYWTTTDVFVLYLLAGTVAIVLTVQAERQAARRWLWWLGAGLSAGLAHLARADGVLLLACLVLWLTLRPAPGLTWRQRLAGAVIVLCGYLLVMLPWFVRNWLVIGAPLAPGATRTIWLTNYNDLFSYSLDRLSPANYLRAGLQTILKTKWSALWTNLLTLFAVQGAIIAFPFGLIGLWHLRRQPLMQLAAGYAVTLFAVMTLVFTFPGVQGSYFHSGVVMVPFLMVAAVAGLDRSVDAAARVLRHWQPERSKPVFTLLLVGCDILVTLAVFWSRTVGPNPLQPIWPQQEQVLGQAGAWIENQGQGRVLTMVNDPPGWYYWNSLPAIAIPNENAATVHAVMQQFGADWLLIQVNVPTPLRELYLSPGSQESFALRAQFVDENGKPAYLYQWVPAS